VNCERCGAKPAEIHYTEYRDGAMHKLQICDECARALGFHATPDAPSETPPALKMLAVNVVVAETPELEDESLASVRCPGCGLTVEELRKLSLFGCAQCYTTFGSALAPLFKRIHGEARHRGRIPGGERVEPVSVDALRNRLREAIESENFEEAARLRDELRRAGSAEDDA
jgi:protein arginine kinase activator